MEIISFQEGFDHCSSFLLLLYQITISLETLNNTNVLSLSYCRSEVQYESHWAKITFHSGGSEEESSSFRVLTKSIFLWLLD